MPRDASGNYTLPAGNPVVTGTTITSNWANTTMSDIGNEITNSLDRSGRGGLLAPLLFPDGDLSNPAIAFVSEPGMGFFRNDVGDMQAAINGTALTKWGTANQLEVWRGATPAWHAVLDAGTDQTVTGVITFDASPTFEAGATFNGQGIFTANAAGLKVQAASAGIELQETDAPADNQRWQLQANGENLSFRAVSDAGAGGGDLFRFTRTNQQIDTFEGVTGGTRRLEVNSNGNISGSTATDIRYLLDAINGRLTLYNTTGTNPFIQLQCTDEPAIGQRWTIRNQGTTLKLSPDNDSNASNSYWQFERQSGGSSQGIIFRGYWNNAVKWEINNQTGSIDITGQYLVNGVPQAMISQAQWTAAVAALAALGHVI